MALVTEILIIKRQTQQLNAHQKVKVKIRAVELTH